MKRIIVGIIIGLLLASASIAAAVSSGVVVTLRQGDQITWSSLRCRADYSLAGNPTKERWLNCVSNGRIGVGFGTKYVWVNVFSSDGTSKTVYSTHQ